MPNSQNLDANQETLQSHGDAVRTAIILAAGMGVRLKDRGKLTPKGCMCLGEKSIVEESVLRLLGVGIERIVIVTGHLAEQFEPLRDRYRQTVQLVHNPHFADSGSMYSLYCARHCVGDAFLLHNTAAILNTYLGSDDWMEVCQLPYRDHRNGGERTGFPDDTFKLQIVLDYLASEQVPALSELGTNDVK